MNIYISYKYCLFSFSIKSHLDVIEHGFVDAISFSSSVYRWLFLSFVYVKKKLMKKRKCMFIWTSDKKFQMMMIIRHRKWISFRKFLFSFVFVFYFYWTVYLSSIWNGNNLENLNKYLNILAVLFLCIYIYYIHI